MIIYLAISAIFSVVAFLEHVCFSEQENALRYWFLTALASFFSMLLFFSTNHLLPQLLLGVNFLLPAGACLLLTFLFQVFSPSGLFRIPAEKPLPLTAQEHCCNEMHFEVFLHAVSSLLVGFLVFAPLLLGVVPLFLASLHPSLLHKLANEVPLYTAFSIVVGTTLFLLLSASLRQLGYGLFCLQAEHSAPEAALRMRRQKKLNQLLKKKNRRL